MSYNDYFDDIEVADEDSEEICDKKMRYQLLNQKASQTSRKIARLAQISLVFHAKSLRKSLYRH